MARDSQAALMALNRFGFGARGGASGDFVDAASDPRGFVKAELSRVNVARLELPQLLSTPALAQLIFAYQCGVRQASAAAKSGEQGGLSSAQAASMDAGPPGSEQAGMAAATGMPPEAPKPPPLA